MDQTPAPRVDSNSATPTHAVESNPNAPDAHFFVQVNHTAVVDSLLPTAHSSLESATSANQKQLVTVSVLVVLTFVVACIVAAMIFLVVRYFMRRAAIKRRRQASWILRSGYWNTEPKRKNVNETRMDCPDSSSFSAYPYSLSEHFSK